MAKKTNKLPITIIVISIIIFIIIGIIIYINHSNSTTPKTESTDVKYSNFSMDDKINIKIYQGDSLDFSYIFDHDSLLKEILLITSGNLAIDSNHDGYVLLYKNDNIINKQTDSFFNSNTMTEFKIPLGNNLLFKAGDKLKIVWNVKTGTSNNNSFYVYFSNEKNKYILPVVINFEKYS